MLMVIFGAGASFDSSPYYGPGSSVGLRPPLANDLFAERYFLPYQSVFPECVPVVPHLMPRNGGSIEDALQKLQNGATQDPRRHTQLTSIRYYLRQLFDSLVPQWLQDIKHVTTYHTLIDLIEHTRTSAEPVCLVTFNYDTLLEKTLETFGYPFNNISDYVSGSRFKLFKLHGSANWGHHLEGLVHSDIAGIHPGDPWARKTQIIKHAASLIANRAISGRYSMVGGVPSYAGDPLYPAIAIPVSEKQDFECPADHLAMLDQMLPHVNRILAIGWRAGERHFLNKLRLVSASYISAIAKSDDEAADTISAIRSAGVACIGQRTFAGFTAAVTEPELEAFLAS